MAAARLSVGAALIAALIAVASAGADAAERKLPWESKCLPSITDAKAEWKRPGIDARRRDEATAHILRAQAYYKEGREEDCLQQTAQATKLLKSR